MELANQKSKIFLNKWLPLLVAFLAPILILIIIYIVRGIFPFGEQMYLRSDMYHQYAPFFKQFQYMLKNGQSLAFSWNIGLGTDFASTYAYYLASPLNWIVAFLPSSAIPEIMNSFIIFKSGLMSLFFTYYLSKKFGKLNLLTSSFGIFYALSSYMAAYSWNLMWIDCLVLFPLIILGLERLVKEGKGYLYTICVGICVLSNYYISIMIAFFLIFYFVYLLLTEGKVFGKSNVLKKIVHFATSSFIGGLIGAVCFLPALCTLFGTASGESSFPNTLKCYFDFIQFATHGLMNQEVTMLKGYVPNIYCTILAFALVPLFWIAKKIDLKEKIGKTILLAILIFSFAFNIPAYIWHGFHFPNSLCARHSFIYIFLILLICYEVLLRIKEYSVVSIIVCFALAIGAVIALKFLNDTSTLPLNVFIMCIIFLVSYAVMCLLIRGVPLFRFVFIAAFCAIAIVEVYINTEDTGYGTTNRFAYVKDNEAIATLTKDIDEFYRVEKVSRKTKNDGTWNNYKSASMFSSTTPSAISKFYSKFGMQSKANSFGFYGFTPLSAQLLDVKYLLSNEKISDPLMKLSDRADDENYLYEYKLDSSLGYLVNEDIDKKFDTNSNNPFRVQNEFVKASVGAAPIFEYGEIISGENIKVLVGKDGKGFLFIGCDVDDVNVKVSREDIILRNKKFSSIENERLIDIGDVKEGDVLEIFASNNKRLNIISAIMDYEAFNKASNLLSKNMMEVVEYEGNYVKAKVNVKDDKKAMLLTSIPADPGWSVYIDGKKSNFYKFEDAFLQIPVSEGEHVIEFKYHAPGFLAGLILSIIAILSLIIKRIYCKIQKFE